MTTYIVCWAEDGKAPRPLGTTPSEAAGKELVQWQANQLADEVLPLLEWKHYLSRGTGPGTAHWVACPPALHPAVFEIWAVGELV
jgi:hypothetical protein